MTVRRPAFRVIHIGVAQGRETCSELSRALARPGASGGRVSGGGGRGVRTAHGSRQPRGRPSRPGPDRRGQAVTASFTAPAAQLCAFVLGCAVIHAARAHAEILTRVLAAAAVAAAVLVLLVACLDYTPGAGETYDEISVYAAS